MGHAATILSSGRIVWHTLHRMGDALARPLTVCARLVRYLTQLPIRLVVAVGRLIRFVIHTLCGLVILCVILLGLMALVQQVFGATLHHDIPPNVPRVQP